MTSISGKNPSSLPKTGSWEASLILGDALAPDNSVWTKYALDKAASAQEALFNACKAFGPIAGEAFACSLGLGLSERGLSYPIDTFDAKTTLSRAWKLGASGAMGELWSSHGPSAMRACHDLDMQISTQSLAWACQDKLTSALGKALRDPGKPDYLAEIEVWALSRKSTPGGERSLGEAFAASLANPSAWRESARLALIGAKAPDGAKLKAAAKHSANHALRTDGASAGIRAEACKLIMQGIGESLASFSDADGRGFEHLAIPACIAQGDIALCSELRALGMGFGQSLRDAIPRLLTKMIKGFGPSHSQSTALKQLPLLALSLDGGLGLGQFSGQWLALGQTLRRSERSARSSEAWANFFITGARSGSWTSANLSSLSKSWPELSKAPAFMAETERISLMESCASEQSKPQKPRL